LPIFSCSFFCEAGYTHYLNPWSEKWGPLHLDAWTLIKEEQSAGLVSVETKEVLHLGEEVGVGDVKEVAGLVRLEPIALQNAMQRGLAGRHAYPRRLCLQTTFGPSQRPSTHRPQLGNGWVWQ